MSEQFSTFAFLKDADYEIARVMGEEHRFYKVSVGHLLPWRNAIKNIAEAVALLFPDTASDKDFKQETIKDTAKDGHSEITRLENAAAKFEIIQHRDNQKQEAAAKMVDVLADNMTVLANLIMDSMREDFPDRKTRPTANQFLEAMPVEAVFDMTKGLLQANRSILGPFEPLLEQAMTAAKEQAEQKLSKIGSDSKMPSPTSSNEDTNENGSSDLTSTDSKVSTQPASA